MSSTTTKLGPAFLSAIKTRRTHYQITNSSPIPNSRIEEIVKEAVTHVPSAFNIQSARAVVLFGDQHHQLWQLAAENMQKVLPAGVWPSFERKINGFGAGYGTVLFFEDQTVLDELAAKHASAASEVGAWSQNSAGMHHFTVWTALTLEGLGGSLQHYNSVPPFAQAVTQKWNLPETWKLNAQLVFGTPSASAQPRTYLPIEDRVKVFGDA